MTSLKIITVTLCTSLLTCALVHGQEKTAAANSATADSAAAVFQPNLQSLQQYECPDWFRDAKFGIWANWGPQCVPEQGDWYARHMYESSLHPSNKHAVKQAKAGKQAKSAKATAPHRLYVYHVENYGHPSKVGYKDIIPMFKAENWDPDQLMELYKKAGAKYFVATACHHDNFDLWNSKHHRWNSVAMGPKRDIVGEWQKAAQKQGLKFGVSEHLGASWGWFGVSKDSDPTGDMKGVPYDGNDPRYADLYYTGNAGIKRTKETWYSPQTPDSFKQTWLDRISDLIDNYHPDLLYSDGSLPFGDYGRRMLAHYYNDNLQQHGGKLEAVYNCKANEDGGEFPAGAVVQDVERGLLEGIQSEPWQTDTSVADWYHNRNFPYKTTAMVIHMLADIVSKNGNLLINFPQKADGTLTEQSLQILQELAQWMAVNEEAIFATRPWKIFGEGPSQAVKSARAHGNEEQLQYTAADIRFTTKGDTLYAITLGVPQADVTIQSLGTNSEAKKVAQVTLLGSSAKIDWKQDGNALVIRSLAQWPCDHAVVFKVEFAE